MPDSKVSTVVPWMLTPILAVATIVLACKYVKQNKELEKQGTSLTVQEANTEVDKLKKEINKLKTQATAPSNADGSLELNKKYFEIGKLIIKMRLDIEKAAKKNGIGDLKEVFARNDCIVADKYKFYLNSPLDSEEVPSLYYNREDSFSADKKDKKCTFGRALELLRKDVKKFWVKDDDGNRIRKGNEDFNREKVVEMLIEFKNSYFEDNAEEGKNIDEKGLALSRLHNDAMLIWNLFGELSHYDMDINSDELPESVKAVVAKLGESYVLAEDALDKESDSLFAGLRDECDAFVEEDEKLRECAQTTGETLRNIDNLTREAIGLMFPERENEYMPSVDLTTLSGRFSGGSSEED